MTAQDRLWQMDMMRRFAAGEISEILGDEFLQHDREQRILGLRVAARKAIEVSSAQNRAHFDAYARGVNAYIESHRDRLPIEFRILKYSPRPWTPEDSTLIASQMVKDLNHYPYRDALDREKILAKLGPELTADLYVNTSWHDRPPTVDTSEPRAKTRSGHRRGESSTGVRLAVRWRARGATSQNLASRGGTGIQTRAWCWVRTTGWFPARIRFRASRCSRTICTWGTRCRTFGTKPISDCGNFDAAGVTLPGLPYVIVGHNQRIAWGFTNVGPTVEDVYIETFNPAGEYLTPEGWKAPEHRQRSHPCEGQGGCGGGCGAHPPRTDHHRTGPGRDP